jgi:hypothetical protein
MLPQAKSRRDICPLQKVAYAYNSAREDQGGRPSHLSDAGLAKFGKTVAGRSRAINCITKFEVRALVFEIRQETIRTRINIGTNLGQAALEDCDGRKTHLCTAPVLRPRPRGPVGDAGNPHSESPSLKKAKQHI